MQKLIVVVADACSDPERLAWNRANLPGYREVLLRASLEKLARRDLRGVYARANAGQRSNVVGVDIPWHEPASPDLTLNMDDPEPPEVLALRVAVPHPGVRRGRDGGGPQRSRSRILPHPLPLTRRRAGRDANGWCRSRDSNPDALSGRGV